MLASLFSRRKALAVLGALALSACAPVAMTGGGGAAPELVAGAPVPVALLVPAGSPDPADGLIARSMENAARLAIADLSGVAVDLRVYPTASSPAQAGQAARQAVADGAAVILGPLRQEEANAAAVAVAGTGVNVLAFTNNTTIAGGNLFVLGPTFQNTAERLARYARSAGVSSFAVAYGSDPAGTLGRDAIVAAVNTAGGTVPLAQAYPLSQQGIAGAAPAILQAAQGAGAQALFTTAVPAYDLPVLAEALTAAGHDPGTLRLVGLTRWDSVPGILAQPALQGGLFAIPDYGMTQAFEARYQAAYGEAPHPLAALAYDGIAAVGALALRGGPQALGRASLTQGQGFEGTAGIFRLLPDGTNQRGLAVATVQNNQVVILDPAPRSFRGAGL